jgi:2'-5' RNA ligase
MHLTLGFFPQVDAPAEEKLRAHLSAISFGSFVLPVKQLGVFPPKGPPKVAWIGVGTGHPHLFQIHQRVQDAAIAAGLEADLRPWHPHITLARCRDLSPQAARKFLAKGAEIDAGMFRVEDFSLFSSQLTPAGSIYTRELSVHCR